MKTYLAFYPTGSVFFWLPLKSTSDCSEFGRFYKSILFEPQLSQRKLKSTKMKRKNLQLLIPFPLDFPIQIPEFLVHIILHNVIWATECITQLWFELGRGGWGSWCSLFGIWRGGGWKRLKKYVPTIMVMCLQWIFYLCWNKNILCWVQRKSKLPTLKWV